MAITVVQSALISGSSSGDFTYPTTAGNTLVVLISAYATTGTTITTTGVTLGASADHFTQLAASQSPYASSQTEYVAAWIDPSCAGGQTAISAAVVNGQFGGVIAYEVAGLGPAPMLDVFAANSAGTGTAVTSGTTAPTASASEIWFGATSTYSAQSSIGPGYSNQFLRSGTDIYGAGGYQIPGAVGTTSYTATQAASGPWAALVVTIAGSAAAGASPAPGPAWRRHFRHRQQPAVSTPVPVVEVLPLLTAASGLSASGNKAASGSSAISGTGAVATPPPMVIQQVPATSTYDYGFLTANLTTTARNTLVVLAGWDLSVDPTDAAMPAVHVTDSAGNVWRHAGTTSSSVTGSRCCAWICTGARAVTWVSVSLTTFASSLAATVLEVANMPANYSLDIAAANSVTSASTLAVSAGTAAEADIAFTVLAAGADSVSALAEIASGTWDFTTGTQGWAGSYASVAQSTAWPAGGYSLAITSDGTSTSFWQGYSSPTSASPGDVVTVSATVHVPQSLGKVQLSLHYGGSGDTYIAGAPQAVSAGQTVTLSVTGTAPAGTTYWQIAVVDGEASAAGLIMYAAGVTWTQWSDPSGAGWTALTPVTSGAGEPNPVQIFPFWSTPAAGTSLDVNWNAGRMVALSGVTFAIAANAAPPVQANPNLPALVIEAGFGAVPGDPSQPPPSWTDVTNRVMAKIGEAFLTSSMGRQYELSSPEAGELHLSVLNWDGAFTPGNADSPFYPDVVLGTPIRALAWWGGQWYHLGHGWTERWPQDWPDMPQFGLSKIIATDVISVMSSATMVSALDADMLLDEPYVLLQASEQYFTYSNGLNAAGVLDSYSIAPAQGLLAANASRVNQRAGTYVDGGAAQAATGQATYMLGDSDTGFGTSSISTAPTVSTSGPGIIYADPNLPSPQSPNGVSVQFWVVIGSTVSSPDLQPTVFTAYGPPSSYGTRPSLTAKVLNYTGSASLQVTLASGATVSAPFNVSSSPQQIVLTLTASSLSIYVNGALATSASLQPADTTTWRAVSLGCPNFAWGTSAIGVGNFVAFDLAVYAFQIPYQRVVSNYSTGAEGQKGVDATTRLAQILAWANLGIPRAGQVTFAGAPASVTQGPAYQLAGQTASDAANQLATNEAGMVIATPSGAVQFMHREALFNLPSQVTFGDSIAVADAQIPYLQSMGFDYDSTYLYNRVTITMQVGPNTTITVTTNDFASQFAYFLRSALQQTVQTTNNLDAYAISQWYLAKYAQPSIRVRTITIDAASHPAAFPAVLGIQQGQVATVTRNPVGGAPITETCIVEKIAHSAGPSLWRTSLQLAPWSPEDAVLQLDVAPNNQLGENTLA